jgi:enamine deaminase RidA (YjgF/YER057c/UK114 family)
MSSLNTKGLLLKNICFSPQRGITLSDKLADCYKQFVDSSANEAKFSVIKQTIFISARASTEYYQNKEKILTYAKLFFEVLPPTSVIAQLKQENDLIVEILYLEGLKEGELIIKENMLGSWLVVDHENMKIVVASGLSQQNTGGSILQQSINAFEQARTILEEEKMEWSDIIRQWNYIEQITANETNESLVSQHYQIFNDVRTKYYNQSKFENGFPAATGIGTDFGGICIDFIAARFNDKSIIIGLKNPAQVDAYAYSRQVLADNNVMSDFCRTTPKFERAKVVVTSLGQWIFVSGTAAITGETSMIDNAVEHQTELTIENILKLISSENLRNHGVKKIHEVRIDYLRAYVKYQKDIPLVMELCKKRFPEITIACVVADVCRPELLVEIEGLAVIHLQENNEKMA